MINFDVKVLNYDKKSGIYTIQYCVNSDTGIVRRSKTTYCNGKLTRDNDKLGLLKEIEMKIFLFNQHNQ